MKREIISIVILWLGIIIHAIGQSKLGNEWITGGGGQRILFTQNGIMTSSDYFILSYFLGGHSCISDTSGHLILASDGYNLYDKNGMGVLDGDTLIPKDFYIYEYGNCAYPQGSIILPIDSNKYYHVVPTFSNPQFSSCQANNYCYYDLLLYNIVDMNANGGSGQVVKRMVPLMQNARLRKTQMQACRHGNGKDWWLLKNEGDSANVHVFLFTQDSVYDKGVQVFSEPVWGPWDIRGQSTFNSDGSMFATTSHGGSTGLIFISEFDRCHGILSHPYSIQMPVGSAHNPADTTQTERLSVGLCFSPNNKYLYIISRLNVYQYNLQDSTWFHVAGLDTSYLYAPNYNTAYLGPDGKIYIGNFGGYSTQMSRIDHPDVQGAGCNFCPRCLRLDSLGATAYVGTPPCMPDYGLGVKTCWPLSQSESEVRSAEWVVYPNPSSTVFIIQNKQGKKKELFNVQGELLFSTKEDAIDVKPYAKGMYYLRVEGQVKKVVVE